MSLQVHTFYEAVGYMIGAQTDQAVQELLIEKYMLLPNQVWDSIIQQATKVRTDSRTEMFVVPQWWNDLPTPARSAASLSLSQTLPNLS